MEVMGRKVVGGRLDQDGQKPKDPIVVSDSLRS